MAKATNIYWGAAAAAGWVFLTGPALAQETPPADVGAAADDAFGRRVGVEEIGLYSESSVRGFSLQDAGNFRIEDSYFVRAAAPINPLISSTSVRVGVNALRFDFPAPSGVYQYRLARARPGIGGTFEIGYRGGNGGMIAELTASAARADGTAGILFGTQIAPWQKYVDGTAGSYFSAGMVPHWSRDDGLRVTGVFNHSRWSFGGNVAYATDGTFLPPRVERWVSYGQPWAKGREDSTLAGVIVEAEPGDGWSLRASTFLSEVDRPKSAFTLFSVSDPDGAGRHSVFLTPVQVSRAWSSEVSASREFATGDLRHALIAAVRLRDSLALISRGTRLDLGTADLPQVPPRLPRPDIALDPGRTRDMVDQIGAGLGYRLSLGNALELRADIQKVHYRKIVRDPALPPSSGRSRPWLYSASAAAALASDLTLFASHTRGLEESGVAPMSAVNRNEVLPAALARQSELGLRYGLGPLSLIGSLFQISKPLPGLRPDGLYDFVGDVRHRGVELSLAGPITDRLSIVAGATLFQARVSGPLVDQGLRGPEPVGVAEKLLLANVTWRTPWVKGLALDGEVTFQGGMQANAENSLQTKSHTIVDLGLRQEFRLAGRPVTLRGRVINLFNRFVWTASGGELFHFNRPRAFTLTLSGNL